MGSLDCAPRNACSAAEAFLSPAEHLRTRESSRAAPSRRVLAVPFLGKDVPSVASEFANAESRIGATTLAYRYQGLRAPDVVRLVKHLKLVLRAIVPTRRNGKLLIRL